MWKRAVDREKKEAEFLKIAENTNAIAGSDQIQESPDPEALEKKSHEFQKILEVPREERDRVQRMQVIDRAAAAIAAARALLKDNPPPTKVASSSSTRTAGSADNFRPQSPDGGVDSGSSSNRKSRTSNNGPPGPNFWSWAPPSDSESIQHDVGNLQKARKASRSVQPTNNVIEKERSTDFLSMPFESKLSESDLISPLPPFQSFKEVHKVEDPHTILEVPVPREEIGVQFSAHAEEAVHALHNVQEKPFHGINPDGSRWWTETGTERRPDGVVCRWTLNRGVTADGLLEWEEKYWEAADEFDYKELGSEKSGRDATGNVWHEYWKESMWQERGLLHIEKTADKWGRNGKGDEWQEMWWEQYDASGKADKWAHKWCSIDPSTQIEAGHAHVWHERWGENYDGMGGSIKYTDKWAERCERDAWVKWGDKWDEHFDLNGHGVKQGESWWEGKYGDRWNRTWGEQHNGSGWVHKYGKSSSGEHWDTHIQEDTWYERYPHYGFMYCFENSVQLREVKRPSETS